MTLPLFADIAVPLWSPTHSVGFALWGAGLSFVILIGGLLMWRGRRRQAWLTPPPKTREADERSVDV